MFDSSHYVPILVGKAGEYGALAVLSLAAKAGLTPLIELQPVPWNFEKDEPKCGIDKHLTDTAKDIAKAWGGDRRAFVDLLFIEPTERMNGGAHPLEWIFDQARAAGLQLVPVTGPSRDAAYQAAVAAIAAKDRRGVCLRLDLSDEEAARDFAAAVNATIAAIRLSPAAVDLVVDLGAVPPSQVATLAIASTTILGSLPSLQQWRTLTLAGGAFPQNLGAFPSSAISQSPRADWAVWSRVIAAAVHRKPTFGDYAVAYPEPFDIDPRIMRMTANLRYAAPTDWLICKARDARRFGFAQINTVSQWLMARPEYAGSAHCWGCDFIAGCAAASGGPGNATTWRKAATAHHLTLVTERLAAIANVPPAP